MSGIFRIALGAFCALWLTAAAPEATAQSLEVRRAQERLTNLGLSPGPVDGIMGSQTRDALRSFQRRKDLPVTGELDPDTSIALAASIRTAKDAAPPPTAAPVPDVSIAALPPPGTEAAAPADDAVTESGARLEEPAAAQSGSAEPRTAETKTGGTPSGETQMETGLRAPAPPEEAGVAPLSTPPDTDGMLARLGPAVALGLAAAAAWIGLGIWWLRQRAGGATPDGAEE